MRVFHVVLIDEADERYWIDFIANNAEEVVKEIQHNWNETLSSIMPSNGDMVEVVGGKIELFKCNEPPEED